MNALSLTTPQTNPLQNPQKIREALLELPDYACLAQDPDAFHTDIAGLESPLLIPGMEQGVQIFKTVIQARGRVLVIGDRDVDGVSSAASLTNFLNDHLVDPGGSMDWFVSDDGDDYGLTGRILEHSLKDAADLVILLDMGSSHGPEIGQLVESGKSVIVIDHHQLHERLPDPDICAFINPMRLENRSASLHDGKIATVGLVFKFLLAYALSFTNEWRRIYAIPISDASMLGYRCGMLLGDPVSSHEQLIEQACKLQPEFVESPNSNQARIKFEVNILQEAGHVELALYPEEWQRLFEQPDQAGSLLLSGALRLRGRLREFLFKISELAAVGLVTDMVPLVGENRALTRIGMRRIPRVANGNFLAQDALEGSAISTPGMQAILHKIGLKNARLTGRDMGWSIGPLLNAAGRMGNTGLAMRLLTSRTAEEAKELTKELVKLNEARKKRTARNEEIVLNYFKENPAQNSGAIVFCYHPDLEPGVSGIVATRLTERFARPAVYIHREDEKFAKGSARTWGGANVLELLDHFSDLFVQFGGHPEAAGFSIAIDHIAELQKRLAAVDKNAIPLIGDSNVKKEDTRTMPHHLEITAAALGHSLFRVLDDMEPFGPGNPEPLFLVRDAIVKNVKELSNGLHIKFEVANCGGPVDFVAWRMGKQYREIQANSSDQPGDAGCPGSSTVALDLSGTLELSYFAGRTRLQFRVAEMIAADS